MAPMVIFLVIVAPLWLILHYRAKKRSEIVSVSEDAASIEQLLRIADKMKARLGALEKILDVEDPKWKEKIQ